MIKIENLNFKFDKNEVIFKDACVEIPKDRVTVILGMNGAGKSTLLKIITKNLKPANGNSLKTAFGEGFKIQNDFKNMFYLPQNPAYPIGVSTFDYVSTVFFKNGWKWFLNEDEKEKVYDALKRVELFNKKDLNLENLSAGELQKANMALGLLSGADLFLLDEPVSNMDLINEVKIFTMLRKLIYNGVTSVLIMHDINIAANFGDYFIGIKKGGKIIQAEKDKFFTKENLKEIYGIDFEIVNSNGKIYVQVVD